MLDGRGARHTTPTATARSTASASRVQGKDRCYGEDSNHDGRIDTWDVIDENGRLTKRAHDSNGDGRVDQAWTFDPSRKGCATVAPDADGDGKPDPGSPVDICQQLSAPTGAATTTAAPKPSRSPLIAFVRRVWGRELLRFREGRPRWV